jgi:hypothetical protein
MHARRAPLALSVADGVHRLVLLAGVFLFALAMAATAVQGSGPRTVEVTFPGGTDRAAPVAAMDAPAR